MLACVVAGTVIALVWPREREPVYKGKTLTRWLLIYHEGNYDSTYGKKSEQEAQEAADAVCQIGTNAIPFLLKWTERGGLRRPAWKRTITRAFYKLPEALQGNSFLHSLVETKTDVQDGVAFCGFVILAANAKPAIPELARMANDGKPHSKQAMRSLTSIGLDAVPSLVAMAVDPKSPGRTHAAFCAASVPGIGTNAIPILPLLIQILQDKNSKDTAVRAAIALGQLTIEPDMIVAALTNSLRDSSLLVRYVSAVSLGQLGEKARIAIPALVNALSDSDLSTRRAATNALLQIAPEALPKQD
jgi:hypothetical protein